MKIAEVIRRIKRYHYGYIHGENGPVPIDDRTTKGWGLFGDPGVKCTGIVTTCWANISVIEETERLGANLIICHEALFWNHGDHTDWLREQKNLVYQKKAELLGRRGVMVWRDQDYVHSGIPLGNGRYMDGIFYGLADTLMYISARERHLHGLLGSFAIYNE